LWLDWERAGVRSRLPLDRPLTIGRDAVCDVRLPDPTVSRRHAVVSISAGQPVVDATGSTNGIRMDRGRADRVALSIGQSFQIGGTTFRVVAGPAAPAAPRPNMGQSGMLVGGAGLRPQAQRQNLLPFAAIGAIGLVTVLVVGVVLANSLSSGGGHTAATSSDGLGVAPPVEKVADDWLSAPPVTDGVTLKYPADWQADRSTDGSHVALRQPDSPTDRPVPTIGIAFDPGVAVTEPPSRKGMSTPERVTVAGLQGWEYHQVGLVTPDASTFIDLPYHGGRLQITATRGPAVNLVPQLDEMLKTMEVAP
jgi:hypothetical protein